MNAVQRRRWTRHEYDRMIDAGVLTPQALPELPDVATGGYDGAGRAGGIKTLKNRLSEYVRVAADGETILVTDRVRVVAELGPPGGPRSRRQ